MPEPFNTSIQYLGFGLMNEKVASSGYNPNIAMQHPAGQPQPYEAPIQIGRVSQTPRSFGLSTEIPKQPPLKKRGDIRIINPRTGMPISMDDKSGQKSYENSSDSKDGLNKLPISNLKVAESLNIVPEKEAIKRLTSKLEENMEKLGKKNARLER